MGMNLSTVLSNFRGISNLDLVLPQTTVWYQVRIPSDKCKLVLVYNNDPNNRLYLTIVQKGLDPNKIGNFNTTHGRILIPVLDGITLSVELDIWVMPLLGSQSVTAWAFSEAPVTNAFGKAYGK